ncbi:MAG: DJ-1/PfpI family protein [Hyphomicrobiaceae bacterium]
MTITKRDLLVALGASIGAGIASPNGMAGDAGKASDTAVPVHDMSMFPAHWHGAEKIAFLAYPQFTALDLVGPHYMIGNLMGATTHIVAKTRDPVVSDMNLAIVPTATFDDCPKDLDVICVPGGTTGTITAMRDEATIDFLRDRGARAKFVASVCTGSLVLGAAGLLRGYKATSHWATRDLLPIFGAEPVNAHVVTDRNRITGAGVTAGLDMGLSFLAMQRDADYARAVQLIAEYHPEPPFDAGTPERAGAKATAMMTTMFEPFVAEAKNAAEAAMRKL